MKISLSKVIDGYYLAAYASRLSEGTLNDYANTFRKFMDFLGDDPPMGEISPDDIRRFLAAQKVSKKTLLNYHIGLSALWTWAVKESLVKAHIVQKVRRPRPEKRAIKPYREEDIRALLNALRYSKPYYRPGKRETTHKLPNEERNRAMILLLVDMGIRSSELCELKIHHLDLKGREIRLMGKGDKERIAPFSARTGKALWKYLATRENDDLDDPLFVRADEMPFDRHKLLKMFRRIGARSGARGTNIHRFRHTFAVNYLRNGGDALHLQRLLGHSTMKMVNTYLDLANADLKKNHRVASPVDHWRL